MDLYGTIEPVNMELVEKTFQQLAQRTDLTVQGPHWASLITAWGCSCKDIDRAKAIFDSIESHPTTKKSGTKLPDAQAYEALINVLVSNHRFELIPAQLKRLQASGLHMTAYIANVVIRGHAASGQIELARQLFESLEDPPAGMAAVYNHHVPDEEVSPDAPVYREPSTWETMVRAEMGSGNRDRAEQLLLRLAARYVQLTLPRLDILSDEYFLEISHRQSRPVFAASSARPHPSRTSRISGISSSGAKTSALCRHRPCLLPAPLLSKRRLPNRNYPL